jgi:hypothetical protein
MKHVMAITIVCSLLIVPILVLVHSDAWSGCTVQQRLELGNQGYDKAEVEKACSESGDDFWDILSKGLATGLANGLTSELNQALGGRQKNDTGATSSTSDASACITNAGTCPLSGGPIGYPCYCQAWNGATFTGLSR